MFKKMIKNTLVIIMCMVLIVGTTFISKADSAKVTIGFSSNTVSVGNTFQVYVTVSGAYDAVINLSYDNSVTQFVSGSGSSTINGGGGTVKISGSSGTSTLTFKAVANGTSTFVTSGKDACDSDGNEISISHASATITVQTTEKTTEKQTEKTTEKNTEKTTEKTTEKNTDTSSSSTDSDASTENIEETSTEEDTRSDNCNLESLLFSEGELSPEFSKSTTSYTLQLSKETTSVVVSCKAEDENAQTSVSGANSLQPGENTIKITVTAENGAVKVYKIKALCGEVLGEAVCTINDTEYSFVSNEGLCDIPESFEKTTMKYKDWDVMAYESPNKLLKVVFLEDSDGNVKTYAYDELNDEFSPYHEFSSAYTRYFIMGFPENITLPEGATETILTLDGLTYPAYKINNDNDIFLVYAMNLNGKDGLYFYDATEKCFMRYVDTPVYAEPDTEAETEALAVTTEAAGIFDSTTEEEPVTLFSREQLKVMLIVLSILFLIMCVAIIILIIRLSTLNAKEIDEDLEDFDIDDVDTLSEENEKLDKLDKSESSENSKSNENESENKADDNTDNNESDADASENETKIDLDSIAPDENGFIIGDASDNEEKDEEVTEEKITEVSVPYGIDSAFDVVSEADYIKTENTENTDNTENTKEPAKTVDSEPVAEPVKTVIPEKTDEPVKTVIPEKTDEPVKTVIPEKTEIPVKSVVPEKKAGSKIVLPNFDDED